MCKGIDSIEPVGSSAPELQLPSTHDSHIKSLML